MAGISAGLEALGTLARSGHLTIRFIKSICDTYAAIWQARGGLTISVFCRTGSDFDLIATIKYLEKVWYHDIKITYEWVKGHADHLKPLSRHE